MVVVMRSLCAGNWKAAIGPRWMDACPGVQFLPPGGLGGFVAAWPIE